MLRCKHEFISNSRQPDFAIGGTRLEKTKAVLTSQLVGSLVCGLLVEGNCNVDQVIANGAAGRSLIARRSARSAESGKTLNHFHEPSSQARRRERGIVVWVRLPPVSLRAWWSKAHDRRDLPRPCRAMLGSDAPAQR